MTRLIASVLAVAVVVGCAHSHDPKQECHVEAGYLDSTNGCSEREGFPDCYKVCADGTRTRVGNSQPTSPPAASH
jgi:hypothetical protein